MTVFIDLQSYCLESHMSKVLDRPHTTRCLSCDIQIACDMKRRIIAEDRVI